MNSYVFSILSIAVTFIYSILYFFFRYSLATTSPFLINNVADHNFGLGMVALFGWVYSFFQLSGIFLSSVRINVLMGVSGCMVGLVNLLGLYIHHKYFIVFSRVVSALGFIFANTSLMMSISIFAKERKMPDSFFITASSIIFAFASFLGMNAGLNIKQYIQTYGFEKIVGVFCSLCFFCGILMYLFVPSTEEKNPSIVQVSVKTKVKDNFFTIFSDSILFLMVLFSITSSIAVLLLLELKLFPFIVEKSVGHVTCTGQTSNLGLKTEKLIGYGFSIGLLVLGFVEKYVARGPINLLLGLYTLLTGLCAYIFYGSPSLYLVQIFSLLLGSSLAAQFCIFNIAEKSFTEKNKPVGVAFSLYNFFYMFSASVSQLLVLHFFRTQSVDSQATSCLRFSLISLVISSVLVAICKIIVYLREKKKNIEIKVSI